MKKVALIFVACMAGTFAAIQFNHWLERRQTLDHLTRVEAPMWKGTPAQASTSTPGGAPDFRAAAKRVLNSVVTIEIQGTVQNWFTDEERVENLGQGSGVVISDNGYIVTNNHVIRNPMDRSQRPAEFVRVHVPGGEILDARVIGYDSRSDLAVIKVDGTSLTPIELGSSKNVEVGEWVLAAGSPLGFENTVSVGVVSSLNRQVDLSQTDNGNYLLGAIQTDASINPGNSGGALVNSKGQLVGINTAIASNTGTSVGIGFAIPVDRVKRVTNDIIKFGRARYGSLGVESFRVPGLLRNNQNRAQFKNYVGVEPPKDGLVISRVENGSPAARAGIERLTVILEIENVKVKEAMDLFKALADKGPGEVVSVKYWKKGQTFTKDISLEDLSQI